jgi:uncharacterized protein
LFVGVPPISANATNAAALWPGSVASVGAYRAELGRQRQQLVLFSVLSLVGGLVGALLLLRTQDALFEQLIPFLMLGATVVFAASPVLTRVAKERGQAALGSRGWLRRSAIMLLYVAVAVYGGFFGAGLGILMLAVLALLGWENIHEMNGLKTLQASLVNGIAVGAFVLAGVIQWPQMVVMMLGAIMGGYGGAAVARRLPAVWVRGMVLLISISLTAYFFIR